MESRGEKAALSDDTTFEAEQVQVRRWREMSTIDKARLITDLCQAADALALAGIRHCYPTASSRECFLRLAILKLGRDLAQRAYSEVGQLPD
jgi:hypothetical protein